jgi:serine/threonine protein kinase
MPSAESCRTPDELRAQLFGSPTDMERLALAAHLESCPRCGDAAEALLTEHGTNAPASTTVAAGVSHPLLTGLIRKLRGGSPPSHGTQVTPSQDAVTLAAPVPSEAATVAFPPPPGSVSMLVELQQLAHYRVIKQLGAGGMGMVYLAEDTKLERRVALKVMRPELAAVPLHAQRFRREALATAKIENDHIVTIFQVDIENGVPFLAMQYLQGESMESWLQRGQRPTPGQAARIGREIALGLAAAHSRGLIHRDIKPGNLWLEAPKGHVKILDFGLARFSGGDLSLTSTGVVVGTPAYMAPEQARAGQVDARADLFSLGVVLFRLCTGQLPFKGGDAMTCMISAAMDAPLIARELNPEIPPEFDTLISKLLEKDPALRPQTALEVAESLARIEADIRRNRAPGFAAGDSVTVKAASSSDRHRVPVQPTKRRRWILAAGVLLGLLVSGFLTRQFTDVGTIDFRTDDPQVRVLVKQDGKVVRVIEDLQSPLKLGSGLYSLEPELKDGTGNPGLELSTDEGTSDVRLTRGKTVVVSIHRKDQPTETAATDSTIKPPEHAKEIPYLAVPFRSAPAPGPSAEPRCLAFTDNGRSLVVGYRTRVQVFDTTALRRTESIVFHTTSPEYKGGIICMALAADGHLLAMRTQPGALVLWDLAAKKEKATLSQFSRCGVLDFSPDGSRLAVGENTTVHIREGAAFKTSESLTGNPDTITALAFDPNGKKLAVGCLDGTLRLWDLASRKHEDISPQPRLAEIISLAFGPVGKRLVVGRPHDAKVLHPGNSHEQNTLRGQGGAVGFSPDARWVALSVGRRLALFDTSAARRYELPPEHTDLITRLAFSPDGKSVATAAKDGAVKLWDVSSLVESRTP